MNAAAVEGWLWLMCPILSLYNGIFLFQTAATDAMRIGKFEPLSLSMVDNSASAH